MKPIKILSGLIVLGLCFGCQKNNLDMLNGYEPDFQYTVPVIAKVNNFVVVARSETLPADFETKLSSYGEIVRSMPEIGEVVVKAKVANFENKVSKLPDVLAVIPDLVVRWIDPVESSAEVNPMSIGDNEYFFVLQWAMDAINAPEAWDAGYTGQGATVFILDNGIDADHPELIPNLNKTLCKSFVPDEEYYVRDGVFGHHGTHVAGIIAAADNGWGIIGVAPYAEIVAVKVLEEESGSGSFSWINAGILYAANNGADVINMSLGGIFNRNGFYIDKNGDLQKVPGVVVQNIILATQRAVDYAIKQGSVIVTAAGNEGMNADGNASIFILPADLEKVITVSATAPDNWLSNPEGSLDIIASYTNYGRSLVDIAAPGGDVDYHLYDRIIGLGAGPKPNTTTWSFYFGAGTSMASPHVAGVAALIVGKNGGEMDPEKVTKQLFKTADKIGRKGISPYYGNGRVNAFRAVTE